MGIILIAIAIVKMTPKVHLLMTVRREVVMIQVIERIATAKIDPHLERL